MSYSNLPKCALKNYCDELVSQGCKNRVSAPPVSAMRTTENEYTGVHADNQVLPTFEILILAYILSFHDE